MLDRRQREGGAVMVAKNTICLWYDKDAEAAARFYVETFPESTMGTGRWPTTRRERRATC